MENFRPLGEKQVMISGVSATERRFRGSVDSRDWSGVVVYIPRGARVYTIFGMTLADTDLVQIQENVISRTITSLQFTSKSARFLRTENRDFFRGSEDCSARNRLRAITAREASFAPTAAAASRRTPR